MSTSSLPPSTKRIPTRTAPVKPPILASDILREEVAPKAPGQRAMRGALLALLATALVAGFGAIAGFEGARLEAPLAVEGCAVVGVVAAFAAFAPVSYASRAILAAIAGAIPLVLGAARLGPLARLGDDGLVRGGSAVLLVAALPAALLFRSRYRAMGEARAILGAALILSFPAVVFLGLGAFDAPTPLAGRVIDVVGIASVALSALGFMGPETSAGCAQWAALVVGAYCARPALRAATAAWSGTGRDTLALTTGALGALVASTLLAFALFQILAAALAGRARRVDVHRAVGPGASDPGPRFHSGFGD
jgi:hypothetical protein